MVFMLMRLNFVHPDPTDPSEMSDRYRAGIDLAAYADKHGFAMVSLEEHQATEMGWSPTPLLNAAMILNRTESLSVAITALLVPLHDPVRLAQEIAVIDLASRGRIAVTAGLGYRPSEYAALQKDWARRGKLLDEAIDTMQKVWSGEEFECNGATIKVGPMPYTRPHPTLMIGGSGPAAAKRAARFGLPLQLPGPNPQVEELYYAECERLGKQGFCISPEQVAMIHVVSDPDEAWAKLGKHFWFEASVYDSWQPAGQTSAIHTHASNLEELRSEGLYQFLTPAQAVDRVRQTGALALHPLVGGMPIDSAWESLELTVGEVMPALKE